MWCNILHVVFLVVPKVCSKAACNHPFSPGNSKLAFVLPFQIPLPRGCRLSGVEEHFTDRSMRNKVQDTALQILGMIMRYCKTRMTAQYCTTNSANDRKILHYNVWKILPLYHGNIMVIWRRTPICCLVKTTPHAGHFSELQEVKHIFDLLHLTWKAYC